MPLNTDLFTSVYKPDVLSCLADLSNDEVFTPPDVANNMLDILPQELFRDPNTKFLDPACKSGVFLREIAKRLIVGLSDKIPNLQERCDWIFKNQLYGIAITELTSLLSRRSIYCSKYADSPFSIACFDRVDGNIKFHKIKHVWDRKNSTGHCIYCGTSYNGKLNDIKREGMESYAYEFIHTMHPGDIFKMKFDVIISNPPYQLNDGGAQASASPIYQLFVKQAMKLNPRYLTMIIPARWYAGGKGLDSFRKEMIENRHLKELHDFPITEDCFPGVNIRGGICYFLWDRDYDNSKALIKVITHNGDEESAMMRSMKYKDFDIFIRYGEALTILNKVMNKCGTNVLSKVVSPRKPFGIPTDFSKGPDFHIAKTGLKKAVKCIAKGKNVGYVEQDRVTAHQEWINRWKVMAPRANNIGTELNDDNLNTFVAEPETICTESYLVFGGELNLSKEQSTNLAAYLQTKFARFMNSLAKVSQDATSKTYRFVPIVDFNKKWTDEALYKEYNLTLKEINFVEDSIKPMY